MSRFGRDTRPLEALLGPTGPEVSCEACFARLDRYVEIERTGGDAERRLPGMRAHLRGCAACAEEHRGLHALLNDFAAAAS